MGLGTKIKEVLHSDKDTKHNTADTSKTPGAFPSDEVPRSQRHADTGALESSGSPRTDNISGKNSSEYTYGAHDSSMTGRDGVTSDRHDTAGTHGTTGTTGSHRNKLSKDSTTAPYWGDAERAGGLEKQPRDATGSTGGRYSPTADRELNNSSHHTSSGRDGAYGAPQTHGLTGAGGSTTHDGSRVQETGRDGMPHSTTTTTGGVGSTGLPHRPLDNDATRRDHKVDEYDAPTNSHGRGHGSLPGAASAGLGAAALANQHHREDMRDYDTQRYDGSGMGGHGAGHHGMGGGVGGVNSGRGYNDSYDNTMSPGGNNSYGQGYGGNGMGSNTMGHNAMGSNTLGHEGMGSNTMGGTGMGPNATGHNGMGYNNGMGPNNNNNTTTMGHNGMGMTRSGVAPGMPGVGPSMLDPHSRNTSPQQAGGAMGGMGGPGADYSGAPLGGGSVMPRIQQHATGMGDGHFGPGHPGAKVLHRCDHCGNDNDISKYFSKEAVYRMS